jgi:flagellin-specific chaperone FliS
MDNVLAQVSFSNEIRRYEDTEPLITYILDAWVENEQSEAQILSTVM